ncbi:MAG TPA: tetratricopeptide repeat protein [Anaerolineales bacterium]|nr:tetratricopeptide repeat protein [Anaerolineales bacterium]
MDRKTTSGGYGGTSAVPILIVLPLLIAIALGVTPRPQALDRALGGARTALENGRSEAAAGHLVEVLRGQPWRASLWEAAGRSALAAGDPETAAAFLDQARAHGAITPAGHLAYGDAQRLLGDWTAAAASWALAAELGAGPVAVRLRLLEAHQALGDYAAAIDDLRVLAELQPGDAAVHYQLGLLLAARQPDAALASLLQAAELDASLAAAVELLEQSLAPIEDVNGGEDFAAAVVLFNAGRALAGLDEWTLAAEAFRQALLANPQYPDAWAFLGTARERLGHDGTEQFETALALDPDSFTANLLYALQLRETGRAGEALPYLEKAAEIAPGAGGSAAAVAAEIAQAYAALGDVNAALDHYLRAVELAPDDPTYLHLLAMFSIYNEIRIDEIGIPAARKAVLADGKDPVALDLLGYAYYLGGDTVSGMRFLFRALDANPGYAPARLHLGMVYLARGEDENAFRQLELAVRLAPGTAAAAQAQEILEIYLP